MLDFNKTWILSTDFRKKKKILNFVKIRRMAAELVHADRRTDMTKLIVAFCNFTNVPKNYFCPRVFVYRRYHEQADFLSFYQSFT